MSAELPAPTGSEFNQVLFLDNDSTQIRLVHSTHNQIESIHIPESEPRPQSLASIVSYLELISDHDFSGNKYLERAFHIHGVNPYHLFDPVSGIQESHVNQVNTWIHRNPKQKRRALLIDWDRTISLFEGYFGDDEGPIHDDKNAYYEDLLLVLLGGAKRLTMIREMLAHAHNENVELFIITNNGGCNDPESGFNNFVAHLFGSIPFTMICGRDFGGHKGRALENDPRFNAMKTIQRVSGGGGKGKKGSHANARSKHHTIRVRLTRRRRTVRFHRRRGL